jgi:hypothetical protein
MPSASGAMDVDGSEAKPGEILLFWPMSEAARARACVCVCVWCVCVCACVCACALRERRYDRVGCEFVC